MRSGLEWRFLAAGACLVMAAAWCEGQTTASINGLLKRGEHAEAARQARSALAALEADGKGESLEAAGFLAQLARALWAGGKVGQAETRRSAERALSIREKLLGPGDPLTGSSQSDLATVLQLLGDFAGALPLAEQAVAVQRKAHASPDTETAAAVDALGVIRYRMGDSRGALESFSEALELYKKARGPESLEVAQALNDVAVAQASLGNLRQAKQSHERVLAIRRLQLGPDHFLVAASLNNLSEVLLGLDDMPGALSAQEQAVSIREKRLGPEHPNVANGWNSLGVMRLRLGQNREAAALFEKSLVIREKVYGPWHWEVAQSLDNLAEALKGEGKVEPAVGADLRAALIFRNHARYVLRTLSEREAARFLDTRLGLATALSLAAEGRLVEPDQRRKVWDAVVRSRGLLFDEMVARRLAVSTLYGSEGAAAGAVLEEARRRLASLLTEAHGGKREELGQARESMERAERELAERSIRFRRELARAGAGYAEIYPALPPESALVSYVTYRTSRFPPEFRFAAFILPAGGQPAVVSIGGQKEVEALVAAWRKEILREAEAPGRSSKRNETSYRRAGRALRQRIWDPVSALLGGAKRVYIVPDGALSLVNFAALPEPGDRYMAETGPVVHFLNTERDLVENVAETQLGKGLLAVGDPNFDLAPGRRRRDAAARLTRGVATGCLDTKELRFPRLPGSAAEVDDIAMIWARTRGTPTVLKGSGVTESSLRRQAPGKQVMHIATHGFFFGEHCGSGDFTAPQPWLLAGLALAGANRSGNGLKRGILTAEDVTSLRLDGLQWVVLSGCDTGLGRIEPHEGVFGLRRAFQLAGARTVIMSLWPVDDESTRQWMIELYRGRFEHGLDTSESVRHASLRVLRARRSRRLSTHPFYWAAFVAAGDWR